MKRPHKNAATTNPPVMPLWPDAGEALGFSRKVTYALAARGEIPGLVKRGRYYKVLREPFEYYLQSHGYH